MTNVPPPASANQPTLNVKAVLSLVCAFPGMIFLPLIGAIAAVILGGLARTEIDRSGGTQTGRGLATAGLIIGWIGIVFSLVALVGLAIILAF